MFHRSSSWNRQHDGRPLQQPRQRHLHGCALMCLCYALKNFTRHLPRSQWKPRNEGDAILLTVVDHVVPFAIGETVAILHRYDRHNLSGTRNMLSRHVRQRHQLDLPLSPQLRQRFHRRLQRHPWIRSMQLVHVNTVHAQPLEAALHRLAKMRRSRVMRPLLWSRALPPGLGGDHNTWRVRIQRLRDQFFIYIRTIRVGRIDEVHTQFHRTTKHRQRSLPILWRSPDSGPREAHRAISETVNRKLATQTHTAGKTRGHFFLTHAFTSQVSLIDWMALCSLWFPEFRAPTTNPR